MRNHIVIAREFAGVKARELAQAVDCTPQRISGWEHGVRNPSRAASTAIAEALNVDPAWIAGMPQLTSLYLPAESSVTPVPIVRSEIVPGYGVLQHVYLEQIDSVIALLCSGCITFVTSDWQGKQPRSAAEIADFCWLDSFRRPAVMMDGLPYLPPMAQP